MQNKVCAMAEGSAASITHTVVLSNVNLSIWPKAGAMNKGWTTLSACTRALTSVDPLMLSEG